MVKIKSQAFLLNFFKFFYYPILEYLRAANNAVKIVRGAIYAFSGQLGFPNLGISCSTRYFNFNRMRYYDVQQNA